MTPNIKKQKEMYFMKVIVFLNNKGGVGKTASATAVAHIMAHEFNKKVLLIDLDPQMNTTSMFSKVDFIDLFLSIYKGENRKSGKSVEDLLLDRNIDIHECIQKTQYTNLDIIPSYITLAECEERLKADVTTPQQFRLKTHLLDVQNEYDYCIIDSSPSINIININGLVAADRVYIPLRCDGYSLLGASMAMRLFNTVSAYNEKLQVGGMFFTQWNERARVDKDMYKLLKEYFGEYFGNYLMPIKICTSKNVRECSFEQRPLLDYDKGKNKNIVTLQYIELTKMILESNS